MTRQTGGQEAGQAERREIWRNDVPGDFQGLRSQVPRGRLELSGQQERPRELLGEGHRNKVTPAATMVTTVLSASLFNYRTAAAGLLGPPSGEAQVTWFPNPGTFCTAFHFRGTGLVPAVPPLSCPPHHALLWGTEMAPPLECLGPR